MAINEEDMDVNRGEDDEDEKARKYIQQQNIFT